MTRLLVVRILVAVVLGFGALALAVSGLRGIFARRVPMRTKEDLHGMAAVGFGVVLLAASLAVAWMTILIMTAPGTP